MGEKIKRRYLGVTREEGHAGRRSRMRSRMRRPKRGKSKFEVRAVR